ncbi:DUF2309 domain-containing protein [Aestuariicoccus sp. KMU-90]|uniref:Probable inorganic carbon transporter subunit DabA n=1 Tax=Thetidibacter halocola TaxID=2827239 RepID=A0A8J7WAN1_9RHOB|nr:DUF2309 domain-containing protein [Thetidibacter halocola]
MAPARISGLLDAAEAACRAIPPAFPLEATVAVNPVLGHVGDDLATASARLARVAGVVLTRKRAEYAAAMAAGRITDEDLADALFCSTSPMKPIDLGTLKAKAQADAPAPQALPTVADLAAQATGTDWPEIIARTFGLWAAGQFDRGQALWTPAPGQNAYTAWQGWASRDLTPEIAGLKGFCAHVAGAPDLAERAILRASEHLGLHDDAAQSVYHRLLMDLGGWAQHGRWLLWQAELDGETDNTLAAMLAIRLVWEEALLAHVPGVAKAWAEAVGQHAAPVAPSPDMVIDAILQDAADRAHQRRLAATLASAQPVAGADRPALQAAFCIDVRSEVFRRALEAQDPGIATIGFAGFFGLALGHRNHGSDVVEAHLPVLLKPALNSCAAAPEKADFEARIAARATRAWGRFRQAAVSSFAFVEAAGPMYGAKLVADSLGLKKNKATSPAPKLSDELSVEARAQLAAAILTGMGITKGHAPLVLLLGHGSGVVNNPHESAYHCGACGGHTGEVSARLLAALLNDPATRAALPAHGIDVPADTLFLAGLHDTASDEIALYPDHAAPEHAEAVKQAKAWMSRAGRIARTERAARLPGAQAATLAERATGWAEPRPEWGLAGCAAFIAAPRGQSAGADLGGRAFLHSYDWTTDQGFATLETILTAPVVVASWISLQYYGSTVAPQVFGGGNKLIHNVTGGIGVVEGNGGRLRTGLPWQAVHDGEKAAHEPLRLSVLVEAPEEAILGVLKKHPDLAKLFDNGWLHLFALKDGKMTARYRPGSGFEAAGFAQAA